MAAASNSLRCDNSVPSWEETASRAFSPVSRGELPSSTARSRPRAPRPTHTDVGEGAGPPSMATQAQVKHFEELAPSRPRVGSQEQPPSEAVRNAGRPRPSLRHSPLEQRAACPEPGTGARAGASRRRCRRPWHTGGWRQHPCVTPLWSCLALSLSPRAQTNDKGMRKDSTDVLWGLSGAACGHACDPSFSGSWETEPHRPGRGPGTGHVLRTHEVPKTHRRCAGPGYEEL